MGGDSVIFSVFLVFTGAAALAALALWARQSLLVAYIALGIAVGPRGLGLITEPGTIEGIGHVGIIFLLFLLGLNLHPQKLLHLLREATAVTLASSGAFGLAGAAIAAGFGFPAVECAVIGAAAMFSSTIIGLKLLPTTALHHRHLGEVIISILLLQDVLAILILLAVDALGRGALPWAMALAPVAALPLVAAAAFVIARRVVVPLIARFDTIAEYVFLTAIGWCLGVAELGRVLGLSYEIGAFVAGVALAASPIATYIAESLKPLRDFFLVMFFFALGAEFPLEGLGAAALPAAALAAAMLAVKPVVFRALLGRAGESPRLGAEVGTRLGQISEFSLLIAVLALGHGVISERAANVIQTATLATFVVSSYLVILRYPSPLAVTAGLRRD